MNIPQKKIVMPMAKAIQGTLGREDHAYMNMPTGMRSAATQARYNRASGPRWGKLRLRSNLKFKSWHHIRLDAYALIKFFLEEIGYESEYRRNAVGE